MSGYRFKLICLFSFFILFLSASISIMAADYGVSNQGEINLVFDQKSETGGKSNFVEIWWNKNVEEKYDVKYAVHDESQNIIRPEHIEATDCNGEFVPLDTWVCFLSRDSNAGPANRQKIYFRLTDEALREIPNGNYKIWLEPRKSALPEKADGKPFWIKLKIEVKLQPEIAIKLSSRELIMEINDPKKENASPALNWKIHSLNDADVRVDVMFESRGFDYEEDFAIDEYFRYRLKDKTHGDEVLFGPGEQLIFSPVTLKNGNSFWGELFLEYLFTGVPEKINWYLMKAGDYEKLDVITITVSGRD